MAEGQFFLANKEMQNQILNKQNEILQRVQAIPSYTEATEDSEGLMSASDKIKVNAIPPNPKYTDTTYENATISTAGLMSSEDKTKIDVTPRFWVGTQSEYDSLPEDQKNNPMWWHAIKE